MLYFCGREGRITKNKGKRARALARLPLFLVFCPPRLRGPRRAVGQERGEKGLKCPGGGIKGVNERFVVGKTAGLTEKEIRDEPGFYFWDMSRPVDWETWMAPWRVSSAWMNWRNWVIRCGGRLAEAMLPMDRM